MTLEARGELKGSTLENPNVAPIFYMEPRGWATRHQPQYLDIG